jgi:hypothetical protein
MADLIVVDAHLSDSGKTEKRPVSAIEGAHALSGVVVDDAIANCSVARAVVEHDVVRRKGIIVVDRPVVEKFCSFLQRRDIRLDHGTEASHAACPPVTILAEGKWLHFRRVACDGGHSKGRNAEDRPRGEPFDAVGS